VSLFTNRFYSIVPPAVFLSAGLTLALGRPPFPEAWNPNPLRYSYAAVESLYLPPPSHVVAHLPRKPGEEARVFMLPAPSRGPIRVLIQGGGDDLIVSGRSGIRVFWLKSDKTEGRESFPAGELRVEFRRGTFRLAGKGRDALSVGTASMRIAPQDPGTLLELNGKSYRGALILSADGTGFDCVNILPIEEYLRGVVPMEMGRPDGEVMEALKAQAVVARTFAYRCMMTKESREFDVSASVQDQVYGGASAEYAAADQAVRETEGRVVLYADTLAMCHYHSTCGGMTASRHEVWGGPEIPYLISRPDRDESGAPWCRLSRYLEWTQSWAAADLAAILRANLKPAGVDSAPAFRGLEGFRVSSRFADGRIGALEVSTDRGVFELHGDKIRTALKSAQGRILRSARFDIEMEGDSVIASGSGFGHGVGMCQMGALGRAQAGQGYEEILEAYYPGTVVVMSR
jgi:stage II sporulation protein D